VVPIASVVLPGESGTVSPQVITTAGTPGIEATTSSEWIRRLEWRYPHPFATRTTAKASVSLLRRRTIALEEDAWPLLPIIQESTGTLTGADLGTAHHRFLELVALHCSHEPDLLRAEAERMGREHLLTSAEREVLDYDAMAAFWQSEVGARIRRHANQVQRELPFTARFDLEELDVLGFLGTGNLDLRDSSEGEWMVVQCVVDLAVILPAELWILDFKTDRVVPSTLPRKVEAYRPQLQLYTRALARIYRRPVRDCWLHFLALRETVRVEEAAQTLPIR
jgi:ATP-dependent helicase/nuclease subunit A